jgi:glutathione-regulated potassium-efflux system protein KefB
VVAAPLAKLLRVGNVLGYLLVGVLIGPFGLGFVYTVYEVSSVLHFCRVRRGAAAVPDRPGSCAPSG